jgi:hypothetical protein
VDNSFSSCKRLSGWFSLHSACLIGCFILSLSIPICSQHHCAASAISRSP